MVKYYSTSDAEAERQLHEAVDRAVSHYKHSEHSITLSAKEAKDAAAFINKHVKCAPEGHTDGMGGRNTGNANAFVIIETPTEICPAKTIRCNNCGATKNITDWDLA
jgi:hypothetical protein